MLLAAKNLLAHKLNVRNGVSFIHSSYLLVDGAGQHHMSKTLSYALHLSHQAIYSHQPPLAPEGRRIHGHGRLNGSD
jgi:hypothetical protein